MATRIYNTKDLVLLDGTHITIKPLKIKYLHNVMEEFENVSTVKTNDEYMDLLIRSVYHCLQQFCPDLCVNTDYVEENVTMPMINDILDLCAGIKVKSEEGIESNEKSNDSNKSSWKDLDLLRLESEVFMVGIWKDFEELEANLSMPELIEILNAKREAQAEDRKFFAAIEGIDLDKANKNSAQNKWEEMKARVFSGGATSDPNDILSLQGVNAQKLGFGIGMGLEYEDARDPNLMKN